MHSIHHSKASLVQYPLLLLLLPLLARCVCMCTRQDVAVGTDICREAVTAETPLDDQ